MLVEDAAPLDARVVVIMNRRVPSWRNPHRAQEVAKSSLDRHVMQYG
jgi:hypothetical protein